MPGPEINEIGIHGKQTFTVFTTQDDKKISVHLYIGDHGRLMIHTGNKETWQIMVVGNDGKFHPTGSSDERDFAKGVLTPVPGAKPIRINTKKIRDWQKKQKPPRRDGEIKRGARKPKKNKG